MATHSTILTWKILCAEEPGGLSTMGSQRTGHNPVTKHTNEHVTLPTMWASHLGRGRSITKSQQMMVACGDICLRSHSDSEPEQCRDTIPAPPTTETVRNSKRILVFQATKFWCNRLYRKRLILILHGIMFIHTHTHTHTHTHIYAHWFFFHSTFSLF